MGVLSKTFVKRCTKLAWHIFHWLTREALGLHTGVLSKMFAMSVLNLKTKSFDKYVHSERKTQVCLNHRFHSVAL